MAKRSFDPAENSQEDTSSNDSVPAEHVMVLCAKDVNGATALIAASEFGHEDVVGFLLKCSADANLVMCTGASPLYVACQNGHAKTMCSLLDARASTSQVTGDGVTPLLIAAQNGHVDIVRHLVSQRDLDLDSSDETDVTPLYIASQNGHIQIVRSLLERRAAVESRNSRGATPLFTAAQNGQLEIVESLLRGRADVNAEAQDGATPLIMAAHNGHVDVLGRLIPEAIAWPGGRVGVLDKAVEGGATATFLAAQAGQTEAVKLLLYHWADPETLGTPVVPFCPFILAPPY